MLSILLVGALLQDSLNQLPEKAVTLDFVIAKAIEASDSFKAIKANQLKVATPALFGAALYDPTLKLTSSYLDDEAEPVQPFMPLGTETWMNSLSASGQTPFGQQIQLSVSHQKTTYSLTSSQSRFHQARIEAQIRQSLWKNFLGEASRASYRSGKAGSEALQAALVAQSEQWLMSFVELFHNAWLAQKRYKSAVSNYERRARLKRVTDARLSRGSALQNDALQVESAVLNAEVERERAHHTLEELWRALVIGLNLPNDFLHIDPAEIPMKLDSSMGMAEKLCQSKTSDQILETNAEVMASTKSAESKALEAQANKQNARFMVDLFGGVWASNNEVAASSAFGDSFSAKNPGWIVGGEIKVPLMNARERADRDLAIAESRGSLAQASLKKSEIAIRWTNECEGLRVSKSNLELLKVAFEKQNKRETIERRRFEMGDASAFQVVQAGDDMSYAELAYDSGETEIRNRSWRILVLSGALIDKLLTALQ